MSRHAHHCAGSVIHDHIVCDPDRYLFIIDRIDSIFTREHADFLGIFRRALYLIFIKDNIDKIFKLMSSSVEKRKLAEGNWSITEEEENIQKSIQTVKQVKQVVNLFNG